ncbi:MAG: type II toxin-antitoxin system HipA family toxin [Spirochaetia bacterium]|nr:type II toxin-antitoxin system HipA family toxin [Spirochaetia bacterium]
MNETGRIAYVFVRNRFAGTLQESDEGYRFKYDASYLDAVDPVSLTLPVREAPYDDRLMHPFFDGLIPEGWLLNIAVKNWKLDPNDRMGLLSSVCSDTIGYVSVLPTRDLQLSSQSRLTLSGADETPTEPHPISSNRCLVCARELNGSNRLYHDACSKRLFGSAHPPVVNLGANEISEMAKRSILNRITIPGVQKKLSVEVTRAGHGKEGTRITIVDAWGTHILKPPSDDFEEVPENEHLTLMLAEETGIQTEAYGLVQLSSGERSFVAKRFDRDRQDKFACEDFCQLLEHRSLEKYRGSVEQIAKAIARFSSVPGDDLFRFFELVVFCFLTGNADMHLKNFSLLTRPVASKMNVRLSPAYDLLNTAIVIETDEEESALTIDGRKKKIQRENLLNSARTMGLADKVAERALDQILKTVPRWEPIIERSFLSKDGKSRYSKIVSERAARLRG